MQVPRYFCSWGSLSKIPSSRDLVGGPLPTPWRKPRYREYPLPRIPRYRRRLQILTAPLSSCLPAPSLWYPTLAGTREKRYGSFIVSAV